MLCKKKMQPQTQKILGPIRDPTFEKKLNTINITNSQLNFSINNSPKNTL